MRILITGGTGFIGSRLAIDCLERGHDVQVLGQENNEAEVENRRLIESCGGEVTLANVTEIDSVTEAVQGVDIVYHLAAAQHEANVPDQHFWDVNVTGTKNMLEASVSAGVKRFVHGSTIGVYGSALEGTLDENSLVRPENIYGVTKLEGEKLVLSFSESLPVAIVRISETYGPGDRRLLKLFRAINKGKFFMVGKGKNLHHPIYVDDLIARLHLAATSDEALGRVFVLSGKDYFTTNEMVSTIAEELGAKTRGLRAPLLPLLVIATIAAKTLGAVGIQPPIHPRMMDFFRKSFVFVPGEATRSLGVSPQYSFRQGVRETATWYRQQGYLN